MNKTKISKIGRRGKTMLAVLIAVMFVSVATAALIPYFGQIKTTATVSSQAVQLGEEGIPIVWYSYNDPITHTIPDALPGETYCFKQWIRNSASVPVDVTFTNNDPIDESIITTYSKPLVYSFDATIAGVGVTVEDTGDWLLWTYTYDEVPTHTPKMTVAIDYPDGFAITTFDDGAHDGWYYAPDGGAEVRFADYAGGSYSDWVVTTASGNVLTVKILKSELGDSFHWHGYANYNGAQVWINGHFDGTGYGDLPFEVDLWQPLIIPFEMESDDILQFRICYAFDLHVREGSYTLITTVDATESTT